MPHWVSILVALAAVLCWPKAPVGWWPTPDSRSVEPEKTGRGSRSIGACLAIALAILMVWPDAYLLAIAAGCAAGLAVWLSGDKPSAAAGSRSRAQLSMLCELWAAGLDSGLGVGSALTAALDAVGGVGAAVAADSVGRLARVAGLLQLGADSTRSWMLAEDDPLLLPMATAARRASAAGADLATTIREQARAIRRAELGMAQRRANRAGVLMTAPLALCFLPSFICLGLAPVVIALIETLDIGR